MNQHDQAMIPLTASKLQHLMAQSNNDGRGGTLSLGIELGIAVADSPAAVDIDVQNFLVGMANGMETRLFEQIVQLAPGITKAELDDVDNDVTLTCYADDDGDAECLPCGGGLRIEYNADPANMQAVLQLGEEAGALERLVQATINLQFLMQTTDTRELNAPANKAAA